METKHGEMFEKNSYLIAEGHLEAVLAAPASVEWGRGGGGATWFAGSTY
jgi:hypothetical protein